MELDPELATQRYMIGKDIANAADLDARMAFEVTKLLSDRRQAPGLALRDLSRNAVPMVIARALSARGAELNADATAFMNELGEAGYLELGKQVQAIVDGRVTQDDVFE